MQKGIIGIIIIGLIAAGGFLLWRAQTAELPTSEVPEDMASETERQNENGGFGLIDSPDIVVDLTASNFQFSQTEIRVKQGDIVRINFTNDAGTHDFRLDEFRATLPALEAGDDAAVTFVASEVGTFEYYSSVGTDREMGMVGSLIIEEVAANEAVDNATTTETETEAEVELEAETETTLD